MNSNLNSNLMMMTGGNDNGNGSNFDWNQIANIVGATSMNVSNLSNQMGLVVATVNDMNEKMISIQIEISKFAKCSFVKFPMVASLP